MTSPPELTVVIPTYDRPAEIRRCLEALAASEDVVLERIEVVVVDDGTPGDILRPQLERLVAAVPFRLTVLRQDNAGQASARNAAMAVARGPLWLFLNDDTLACPTLLTAHLRAHADHPDEAIGCLGRMTLAPGIPWTAARSLHLDHMWSRLAGRSELKWFHFWTTNVSLKAAFLRRHRLAFDPAIRYVHDDVELGRRLHAHGFRLLYHPEALGYHDHALTESDFLRMAEREAASLCDWAVRQPDAVPELARFGYTPARARWERAIKYPALAVVFNRVTLPAWRRLARAAWPVWPAGARLLLSQCYAAVKRRGISRARRPAS
ncbi:MAG: glycosyltransferase [Planctomycetes bacterium]|nr:glycosyltransferase [Planctomycetota bacterium]